MVTIDQTLAALLGEGGRPGEGDGDPCRTPLARSSTLAGDIALEGFELVALGEALTRAYAPEADVLGWFAELDVDDLVELTAGQIADFVVWCHDGGR
jgi:acyl carrier protein